MQQLHLVYFSNVTGNTHRFVEKLGWENVTRIPIKGELEPFPHPYVLIVPAYGSEKTGHVPPQVKKFLHNPITRKNCVGVIGSGNMNFGKEYAIAADVVANKLHIPVLYNFELAGSTIDVKKVYEGLKTLEDVQRVQAGLKTLEHNLTSPPKN